MKFCLKSTERTAIFKQSSKVDFAQAGWGLTVKLAQEQNGRVLGKLEMQVSDPAQIKMFSDAPIGTEFEIAIHPCKGGKRDK